MYVVTVELRIRVVRAVSMSYFKKQAIHRSDKWEFNYEEP